jgi:hypothetical protein
MMMGGSPDVRRVSRSHDGGGDRRVLNAKRIAGCCDVFPMALANNNAGIELE